MNRKFTVGGDPANRMFVTARELLWRRRQIHKFPIDKDVLLLSMVPSEVWDYVLTWKGTYKWNNLTRCVNMANSCIVELGGKVGNAFWMNFGPKLLRPCPANSTTAFELSRVNPHYKAVKKWWDEAQIMHGQLKKYEGLLYRMFMKADHPLLIKDLWPDLYKFVKFKPPKGQEQPKSRRRQLTVPLPSALDKIAIIEILAGSTLLPEYTPDVWVDYEVEE